MNTTDLGGDEFTNGGTALQRGAERRRHSLLHGGVKSRDSAQHFDLTALLVVENAQSWCFIATAQGVR